MNPASHTLMSLTLVHSWTPSLFPCRRSVHLPVANLAPNQLPHCVNKTPGCVSEATGSETQTDFDSFSYAVSSILY